MRRSLSLIFKCFLLFGLSIAFSSSILAQADAKGSSDHPLLSRYEGFRIDKMETIDLDRYELPLGPSKSENELGKHKVLEGKITKINYTYKELPLPSTYQIFKNYEAAFKAKGADILFSCMKEECGIRSKKTDLIIAKSVEGVMVNGFMRFGNHAYLAASFSKEGKQYHAAVYIREEKNQMMYELHIIESDELKTDKVSLADIEKGITETGKQAFYGIYFDFGKATITPESEETIGQIAEFLKQNTDKTFYVVGHTDNVGNYETNVDLSVKRADAVVKALEGLGIQSSMLQAVGVGPVSPVKANSSEDNRAMNRRVELVLK